MFFLTFFFFLDGEFKKTFWKRLFQRDQKKTFGDQKGPRIKSPGCISLFFWVGAGGGILVKFCFSSCKVMNLLLGVLVEVLT